VSSTPDSCLSLKDSRTEHAASRKYFFVLNGSEPLLAALARGLGSAWRLLKAWWYFTNPK